ncbi:MAG: glutamyl-tRNA reductase [Pirellulales bacterium]
MKLQLVGCSHHTARLELRERIAFSPEQTRAALGALRVRFPDIEAVVLSTCNRVEIYTATEAEVGPSHQDVVQFLAEFHGLDPYDLFDDLFERTGEDAVRHLFYVAASLDSMVVGEPQILSQVKQAYETATTLESTGQLTHAVFQAALKVARRVANETSINQRRTSIPSVAIHDYAKQIFERFDDKQVLVIGAGEMGEETLRYLTDDGARKVTIVNRSPEKAAELAAAFHGRAAPWEQMSELLVAADLVISTTGSTEPIVTRKQFDQIEPRRFQRPLAILDLAVPRDFESSIGECLGVYLYAVDDLAKACEKNRKAREKEWPAAEKIIEEETARFMAELNHRATAPTIRRLRETCEEIKELEYRRLVNKLPELDERVQEEIHQSFNRLVNKMLHPPLESLREGATTGEHHGLLDALKRLFKIGD